MSTPASTHQDSQDDSTNRICKEHNNTYKYARNRAGPKIAVVCCSRASCDGMVVRVRRCWPRVDISLRGMGLVMLSSSAVLILCVLYEGRARLILWGSTVRLIEVDHSSCACWAIVVNIRKRSELIIKVVKASRMLRRIRRHWPFQAGNYR